MAAAKAGEGMEVDYPHEVEVVEWGPVLGYSEKLPEFLTNCY